MTLQFKKGGEKQSILTVIRNDGSSTWARLQRNFEEHDLAHYAVETVMGYQKAFYGLLDEGYTVEDFLLPREQRPEALLPSNLPEEALLTEFIVNQLCIERWNSGREEAFLAILSESLKQYGHSLPSDLTDEKVVAMRRIYHDLAERFAALQEGEVLELDFQ